MEAGLAGPGTLAEPITEEHVKFMEIPSTYPPTPCFLLQFRDRLSRPSHASAALPTCLEREKLANYRCRCRRCWKGCCSLGRLRAVPPQHRPQTAARSAGPRPVQLLGGLRCCCCVSSKVLTCSCMSYELTHCPNPITSGALVTEQKKMEHAS